jgi:hypothetical protein
MKKFLIMAVAALMVSMSAMAQIPANIMDVLNKCDQKMDDPNGMIIDMTLKTKILVLSLNGTMRMYEKGDKSFCEVNIKALGKEIRTEQGFDGQQKWEYTALSGKEKNTLKITKTQDALNKLGPKNNYEKDYKKAKMEESGLYYVITFSEPLKKGVSEKAVVKIAKKSYILHEYSVDEDMGPFKGKITITITKITKGCRDSWFKLDMNRYKNATVVRQ